MDLALQGHNLYIAGQAGTGKTLLIYKIYDKLRRLGKSVHCTCSTGIACAVLLASTKATTIHSWAGVDDGR